nr:virulence RhuM family protein [Acholeplasmatales bacterium]
ILFNYDEIKLNVNVDPNEDTVWLNKEQLITLFDTTRQNLEYHINNIYSQNELEECSTCKKILQVQIENNRDVTRPTNLYNLDMIISLGYRINSN